MQTRGIGMLFVEDIRAGDGMRLGTFGRGGSRTALLHPSAWGRFPNRPYGRPNQAECPAVIASKAQPSAAISAPACWIATPAHRRARDDARCVASLDPSAIDRVRVDETTRDDVRSVPRAEGRRV
jgi:hypothetical protein